jgi:hypothetical protein
MTEATESSTPALQITFGDDTATFKAHPDANQFLIMRHIDDLALPGFASLKAVTVLVLDQVLDEERPALEEFLLKHGREDDYSQILYDSLQACWSGETVYPFGSSSDSAEATSETDEPEPLSTPDSSSEDTVERNFKVTSPA